MSENNAIISAPELTPVFSFRTSGGGDIYVYLAKTEIMKVALITYDDTSSAVRLRYSYTYKFLGI